MEDADFFYIRAPLSGCSLVRLKRHAKRVESKGSELKFKLVHYVYILKSLKWKRFYTGETSNLEKRFKKHNVKAVKSTKHGTPWELIWFTEVNDRINALKLEQKIKKRGAKRFLND